MSGSDNTGEDPTEEETMDRRFILAAGAAALTALAPAPAAAQDAIRIPNIIELSGGGATVGTMWRNASAMAAEEINAKGGILGRRIQLDFIDTGSDPGRARAAIERALDSKPIAIFGPIYSVR